jgi:hypothetical protein
MILVEVQGGEGGAEVALVVTTAASENECCDGATSRAIPISHSAASWVRYRKQKTTK